MKKSIIRIGLWTALLFSIILVMCNFPHASTTDDNLNEETGIGSVYGLVIDMNGAGISGALVVVKGANLFATSDRDGYFVINGIPVGKYDVRTTRIGYHNDPIIPNVKIGDGEKTVLNFTLDST